MLRIHLSKSFGVVVADAFALVLAGPLVPLSQRNVPESVGEIVKQEQKGDAPLPL
jgi:hypothetical protein